MGESWPCDSHARQSFCPSLPLVESSIRLPRHPHPFPGFCQRPGDLRETEAPSPSARLKSRDYAATTWRCPLPLVERLARITMSTSWPRLVMNLRSQSMEKAARRPRRSAETLAPRPPKACRGPSAHDPSFTDCSRLQPHELPAVPVGTTRSSLQPCASSPTSFRLTVSRRSAMASSCACGLGERSGHPPLFAALSRYRPSWLK
jgi:hypothetical protein